MAKSNNFKLNRNKPREKKITHLFLFDLIYSNHLVDNNQKNKNNQESKWIQFVSFIKHKASKEREKKWWMDLFGKFHTQNLQSDVWYHLNNKWKNDDDEERKRRRKDRRTQPSLFSLLFLVYWICVGDGTCCNACNRDPLFLRSFIHQTSFELQFYKTLCFQNASFLILTKQYVCTKLTFTINKNSIDGMLGFCCYY